MPAANDQQAGAGALMGLLASSDKLSDRLKRVMAAYLMVATTARIGKRWWDRARAELTYTVAVPSDDPIYPTLHAAVLEQLDGTRRRALTARSSTGRGDDVAASPATTGSAPRPPQLALFYDGGREQRLSIEGHTVKIIVDREHQKLMLGGETYRAWQAPDRLVFTTHGAAARDAVIRFVEDVTDRHHSSDRTPDFLIAERWGGWERRDDLPRRSLDTVALRAGQKERLGADLEHFLAQEDRYARLGIPWHRGILLEGPPGTGKTSVAQALATHFGLDVFFVPLGTLDDDARLLQMVTAVRPRSMLVLEDVDVLHAAKHRDAGGDGKALSLSGLLNALDGMATPHGLVTVMTTNHPGVLDDALVRPGRVDVVEHIGYLDDHQLHELVTTFLGPAELPPVQGELTPAAVIEQIKRHEDPAEALDAITDLLTSPTTSPPWEPANTWLHLGVTKVPLPRPWYARGTPPAASSSDEVL